MRRKRAARPAFGRILAALALALALPAAAMAQDEAKGEAKDDAPANPTRVIQGMSFGLYATESPAREGSPFSRLGASSYLSSTDDASYSLSFRSSGISGQLSARAEGGPSDALAVSFDQAWIKAVLGDGWALAFGRRYLKWKDGGYWNPSDVVNYRLAWASTGQAPGRDSIEVLGLLPFTDFNVDLSAATVFSKDYAEVSKQPLYLAAGSILYPFELRTKAVFQADRLPLVGGALKLSLPGAELYCDLIHIWDHPLAGELGFDPGGEGWFRWCAGGDWSADVSRSLIAQSLSLRLEYLRQDDALTSAQGSAYFDRLEAYDLSAGPGQASYAADAGTWNGRFFSLYRDYLFANIALGEIANAHVSLGCSGVLNLDDRSLALQGSLGWSPRGLFDAALALTAYLGGEGSEARALPQTMSCALSLSKSF